MGPGCPNAIFAAMPCYLCGSRVKKGIDPNGVRLRGYGSAEVMPEGVYRVCRACDEMRWDFSEIHRVHELRAPAGGEYASLRYYHPPVQRERF